MLTHLSIQNFTLVDNLDIEFENGMTVITGETGAGKSIMLDALGLCLGDRADPKTVRTGAQRADICASFDVRTIPAAQRWLQQRDLYLDDEPGECLLRRVITAEGRSRAYINGQNVTLPEASKLGELLIDIHSQHAHQSLLRRETQRGLLDAFAGLETKTSQLAEHAEQWQQLNHIIRELEAARDERGARVQLLSYQVGELDELNLQADELPGLEQSQKQLANAEDILSASQQALELIEDDDGGLDKLRRALALARQDQSGGQPIANVIEALESACIQADEARLELQSHIDTVEIDPEKLLEVESRLDLIYETARKHRVQAPQLAALHQGLAEELAGLAGSDEEVETLKAQREQRRTDYDLLAKAVSKKRQTAAKKLTAAVETQLAELAMEQCKFAIELEAREPTIPHPQGMEVVEFRIATNPGAKPQTLGKIASGGELSRISLAIQVVTAKTIAIPSMVFDEVDVGIGGAVAEVVGKLLRALGERSQVLCVTHLAQVAAQGNHHLVVTKTTENNGASAKLSRVEESQKVEEIARMLGGVKITDQSRAHAEEMLSSV
ncbi:MAG: DNA repair protein RecN (Recombination protein N) [Halieaceae bacterium]|jgi:DNA repair protein RecN (Recombination protein N)